jgi:hypothetical protein
MVDADFECDGDRDGERDGDRDGDRDGEREGDEDGVGGFLDGDGEDEGDGMGELDGTAELAHPMESTKLPVAELNPSTPIMYLPVVAAKPVMTAAYSLAAHVPQLSHMVTCWYSPSEKTRRTVSMELPQVLNE